LRKTKVRIVGDPELVEKIAKVLLDHFEVNRGPRRFPWAVGRDYSHNKAPGRTIYIDIKKEKEASPSPNNAYPFSVGEAKARGLCAADNEVSDCKLCPCWSGGDQGWLDCEEWRDYERKEEASE